MMVKLKGPSLAHQATGTLAGQLTFSSAKGRQYLKKKSNPAQPRTPAQVSVRAAMKFLSTRWATLPSTDQQTWAPLAVADNISPFNAYQRHNLTRWANFDFPTRAYPAAQTDPLLAQTGMSATPGPQSIRICWVISWATNVWGCAINCTPASGDPVTKDMLIQFHPWSTSGTHCWLWTHLPPGTYYIAITHFSYTGKMWTGYGRRTAHVTG